MKKNKLITVILVIAMALMLLSGCAVTDGADSGSSSGWTMYLMMGVLVVVFYFFMIRPENKRKKKLEQMRNELAVGEEITTIGGIVGKIVHINSDFIVFETGEDRVRLQVAKWAISTTGKQTEKT